MSNDSKMSFLEHLGELRKRIIFILIILTITSICGFCFADLLLNFFIKPFSATALEANIIGTAPAEAFLLRLKVSIFAGFILALPFIFYHLWAFIAPGLYASEKKLSLVFIFFTTLLFILGATFSYYLVLPYAFQFFISEYHSLAITPQIKVSELISFILNILLVFGVIFDIPIISFLLARVGILTPSFLIKWFRPAIVTVFVVAAVLTPPDIFTQLLMAIPLLLLYGISILIVKMCYKKRI